MTSSSYLLVRRCLRHRARDLEVVDVEDDHFDSVFRSFDVDKIQTSSNCYEDYCLFTCALKTLHDLTWLKKSVQYIVMTLYRYDIVKISLWYRYDLVMISLWFLERLEISRSVSASLEGILMRRNENKRQIFFAFSRSSQLLNFASICISTTSFHSLFILFLLFIFTLFSVA